MEKNHNNMGKTEQKQQPDIPIETALEQLEQLIARLESKECTLEESFHLYKDGIGLVQYCSQTLSEVEQQLTILNEGSDGNGF